MATIKCERVKKNSWSDEEVGVCNVRVSSEDLYNLLFLKGFTPLWERDDIKKGYEGLQQRGDGVRYMVLNEQAADRFDLEDDKEHRFKTGREEEDEYSISHDYALSELPDGLLNKKKLQLHFIAPRDVITILANKTAKTTQWEEGGSVEYLYRFLGR